MSIEAQKAEEGKPPFPSSVSNDSKTGKGSPLLTRAEATQKSSTGGKEIESSTRPEPSSEKKAAGNVHSKAQTENKSRVDIRKLLQEKLSPVDTSGANL